MKTMLHCLSCAGMLALLCLSGVSPAGADELKIGAVNLTRILDEAPQAEAARKKLEKEFAPREADLAKTQQELQRLEEKLERDAAVMSEDERRKLDRDVLAGKRDFKRVQEEFREDLNIRRNDELNRLQREVYEAIVGLANRDGFDLIVGEGVVFAGPKVDVTSKVLDRLRQQSAGTAPAKK